jgi:hypothetical protein
MQACLPFSKRVQMARHSQQCCLNGAKWIAFVVARGWYYLILTNSGASRKISHLYVFYHFIDIAIPPSQDPARYIYPIMKEIKSKMKARYKQKFLNTPNSCSMPTSSIRFWLMFSFNHSRSSYNHEFKPREVT